jgi:hypothetical protein
MASGWGLVGERAGFTFQINSIEMPLTKRLVHAPEPRNHYILAITACCCAVFGIYSIIRGHSTMAKIPRGITIRMYNWKFAIIVCLSFRLYAPANKTKGYPSSLLRSFHRSTYRYGFPRWYLPHPWTLSQPHIPLKILRNVRYPPSRIRDCPSDGTGAGSVFDRALWLRCCLGSSETRPE